MTSTEERCGDLTLVTTSDIGIRHLQNNVVNQDAALCFAYDGDFVLAVSDGVGSCRKADEGAKLAVFAAKKCFEEIRAGELSFEAQEVVRFLLEQWRCSLDPEHINDYCATFKTAIKIGGKIILISIGDGFIAITSRGLSLISPLEEMEFINQTTCLRDNVSAEEFWTEEFLLDTYVPYVVFACTDGVSNGIQEGRELELLQEIEEIIPASELKTEIESFIADLSEYSADDRTIGVVKYEHKHEKSDRLRFDSD